MTIDEKLRSIVARQASPEAAVFRKQKSELRRVMIESQRAVGNGAAWSEDDDMMLDAVSAWLVTLADANGRGDGVPPSTREVAKIGLPRSIFQPPAKPDGAA